MVDTSKFTLDTPVKIKNMESGIWLPELSTYTPVISYASIDQVISMLNRGINLDFPQQSSENEISKKIEEILLDYQERKNYIKNNRHMEVGTNIDKALDTIQDINDSKITVDEELKEKDRHIFDHSDISERIIRDLSDNTFTRVFESDDFISSEDRIKRAEKERISRKNISNKRKEALKFISNETEIYTRLAQDGKYTVNSFDEDIEYIDPSEGEGIDFKEVAKKKK